MANIAISELDTTTSTLKNDDYILVSSKNNNGSFTSAKMTGSSLKNTINSSIPSATSTTSGLVIVDSALSATSTNPVQNKVVKEALDEIKIEYPIIGPDSVKSVVANYDFSDLEKNETEGWQSPHSSTTEHRYLYKYEFTANEDAFYTINIHASILNITLKQESGVYTLTNNTKYQIFRMYLKKSDSSYQEIFCGRFSSNVCCYMKAGTTIWIGINAWKSDYVEKTDGDLHILKFK